jgi:hypothetical protein
MLVEGSPATYREEALGMKFGLPQSGRRFATYTFAAAFVVASFVEAGAKTPPGSRITRSSSGPPACTGQRTKASYGSSSARLTKSGGSFCVPAFGGFGGSIEYPKVERSVKLTVRTSTQNVYNEPLLGTGTPIVYLNVHFHAGTHFAAHVKSMGGLTSEAIQAGATYTAYGIVNVGHLSLMFPPCYSDATQGPYGGVLSNLGELFIDTTITGAGFGVIEIYPGAQVSEEC